MSHSGNELENGLRQVGREDVIKKAMYNVEVVEDELEAAAARAAMDQSGLFLHPSFLTYLTQNNQSDYISQNNLMLIITCSIKYF